MPSTPTCMRAGGVDAGDARARLTSALSSSAGHATRTWPWHHTSHYSAVGKSFVSRSLGLASPMTMLIHLSSMIASKEWCDEVVHPQSMCSTRFGSQQLNVALQPALGSLLQ